MDRLTAAFPELSAEVASSLGRMGHLDLAQQFQQSRIHRVTFDNSADAAYIYLSLRTRFVTRHEHSARGR